MDIQTLREKRDEILRVAERHGAFDVRVFGSVARGEARAESDVDFLVKTKPRTSAWFPASLILDLEDLLGRKVDVLTEGALHRLLRDRILAEARAL